MSNHEEYNIKILNRMLNGVKFHYNGSIMFNDKKESDVTYEITDVIDVKKKYWMGDPITIYYVNAKIVGGDEKFKGLCERLKQALKPNEINSFINTHLSVLINNMGHEVLEYSHDRIGLGRENYRAKLFIHSI